MPIWMTLVLFVGASTAIVAILFTAAVTRAMRSVKRNSNAKLSSAVIFVAREWLHAALPRVVRSNWEVQHGVKVDERPLLDALNGRCTERHAMHRMGITKAKEFHARMREMKLRLQSHGK